MSVVPTRPSTAYLYLDSGVTTGSDLERRREAMTGAVSLLVLTCTGVFPIQSTSLVAHLFVSRISLRTLSLKQRVLAPRSRRRVEQATTTASFSTNIVHGTA